nr:GATA zinc finger domain-containing protein 14-like [Dermatophagoides farinae]
MMMMKKDGSKQSATIQTVIETFYKKINKKNLQRRQQLMSTSNINMNMNDMLFSSTKSLNKATIDTAAQNLANRMNHTARRETLTPIQMQQQQQQQQQQMTGTSSCIVTANNDIPQTDSINQSKSNVNAHQSSSSISNNNNVNNKSYNDYDNRSSLGGAHRTRNLRNLPGNGSQSSMTNIRQRLVMHKRVHLGEILYHCDVEGCGYFSNYKGNIKIHKKHRHRSTTNEAQSQQNQTMNATNTQQQSTSSSYMDDVVDNGNNDNTCDLIMDSDPIVPKRRGRKRSYSNMNDDNSNGNISMDDSITAEFDYGMDDVSLFVNDQFGTGSVDNCNYKTRWRQCIIGHQYLHAGIKPFCCDYPGCKFRSSLRTNVDLNIYEIIII